MFLTSGLLPRARGASAWPAWQQTHPAQPWKVIIIVIIITNIVNIINIVIIIIITLLSLCHYRLWSGSSLWMWRRLERVAQNFNDFGFQGFSPFVTRTHQGLDLSHSFTKVIMIEIEFIQVEVFRLFCRNHQNSVFRFPLLNLESLIVLNTKSCRSVIFVLLILTMTIKMIAIFRNHH